MIYVMRKLTLRRPVRWQGGPLAGDTGTLPSWLTPALLFSLRMVGFPTFPCPWKLTFL